MFSYRSRLQRDLKRWADRGWVSEAGRDAILGELRQPRQDRHAPFAIALGAGLVLVLAGVVAFVGANWDGLPRASRLFLLLGVMASLYAAGVVAVRRGAHPRIPDGLFFLAAGTFGANVLLVAQMYNLSSEDGAAAVMLWCIASLVTVWGTRSVTTLHLVFALLVLWSWTRSAAHHGFDPGLLLFLLPWCAAVATGARRQWKPLLHYAAATLIVFVYALTQSFEGRLGAALFTIAFLAVFTLARTARTAFPRDGGFADWLADNLPVIERYALAPAVAGFTLLYAMAADGRGEVDSAGFGLPVLMAAGVVAALGAGYLQARGGLLVRDTFAMDALLLGAVLQPYTAGLDQDALRFWLHAAYALALILWLMDFGLRNDPCWRFLGYFLFAAHLLHVYFRAFGSLLETSLFLVLGGVILLAAAFAIHRFNLWATARTTYNTP